MSPFKQPWSARESRPAKGIALSPRVLAARADTLGKDQLSIPQLAAGLPQTTEVAAAALYKVIGGRSELVGLEVALARIAQASSPVGQLTTKVGPGTGFMITSDLFMTNNHMFVGQDKRVATPMDGDGLAKFNYDQDINGKCSQTKQYKTVPEKFFTASLSLDYAVVALEGAPGTEWGTIQLPGPDVTIEVDDEVFIIQHPDGGPKQIAMSGNEVAYVDDTIVQYTTDTLPGASGSPVFDWEWQLVALHHAGGDLPEPLTGDIYFRNEGIRLSAIKAELSLPVTG